MPGNSGDRRPLSIVAKGGGLAHHARIVLSVVNRHVSAFARIIAIGKQLPHKVLQGVPSLLENTRLAVLSEDHIIGGQCSSRSNRNTFFPRRYLAIQKSADGRCRFLTLPASQTYHVKAQSPLALCFKHHHVHNADWDPLDMFEQL